MVPTKRSLVKIASIAEKLKFLIPKITKMDLGIGLGGLLIGGYLGNKVYQKRLPKVNYDLEKLSEIEQNPIPPVKTLPRLIHREHIYGNIPNSQPVYPTTGTDSGRRGPTVYPTVQ